MHPAYSVILFTVASGAGYGLLALLGLTAISHGPASSFAFGVTAWVIAMGLVVSGLLSSTLHLGHPERAWRALSQWRSSWLSREGVAAIATFAPALAFAALWLGLAEAPRALTIVSALLIAAAAVTVYCTAMIYASLKTIRQWHQTLTAPVYLAFALATGAPLLMAIAAAFGRWQPAQAAIAAIALTAALALKLLYWRAIDTEPKTLTMTDATGLAPGGGTVRQWEVPHTARNFVMAEMGYSVARRHAQKFRRMVMAALGLAAVMALIAIAAPVTAVVFSFLAAALALYAAAVERWLFFAEAQHVVTLYYGASAA